MPTRRVLLVEREAALARVIARALGRHHAVLVAPSVSRALALLDGGERIDTIVAAYRIGGDTAGKLFSLAQRRWPRVHRILYAHPSDARPPATRLAHGTVDPAAPFSELLEAIP